MLQNTLNRFKDRSIFDKPIIVGSLVHRDNLIRSIKEFDYEVDNILLEHKGKNTRPAIAAAALTLDDNTLMLVLPIDHYISNEKQFLKRVVQVKELVQEYNQKIATLSIPKSSAESNYGHIKLGRKLNYELPTFEVDDFIEKPSVDEEDKDIVWNSGIYSMTAQTCKKIILKHAPHILHHSYNAVTQGVERRTNGLNELI